MPQPIPINELKLIKSQQGMSRQEKVWSTTAIAFSVVMVGLSYALKCPMPLIAGFAYAAFVVAGLEVDEFEFHSSPGMQ